MDYFNLVIKTFNLIIKKFDLIIKRSNLVEVWFKLNETLTKFISLDLLNTQVLFQPCTANTIKNIPNHRGNRILKRKIEK